MQALTFVPDLTRPHSSTACPGELRIVVGDVGRLLRLVERSVPRSHLVSRVVRLCAEHELSARALEFAVRVLDGRRRPSCQEPALLHAIRVAGVVALVFKAPGPELIAGALLHDVLEDTEATPDDLLAEFGEGLVDTVVLLTKPVLFAKAERRQIFQDALLAADDGTLLIKLADYYANLGTRRGSRRVAKTWRGASRFCARLREQRTLRGRLRAAVEQLEEALAEIALEAQHAADAPILHRAA